ncbi:MAG: M48 family metalloprotease [Halothiobacillus sp.]|jgi:Zn-dependent protease with chaperone function/type II secretory pathway pseudopilin PulG|nr:M48 family metalloprotease [Halothiobacillus sp.]
MEELVYPRERTLGMVTLVLGLLAWLALIVGTFGIVLIWMIFGFVVYLFVQSALIAHIRGNGVELSETQFPDLYAQFSACCDLLQIKKRPQAYILNENGTLNAFATKFLGAQYVVLMSGVVDAMDQHADGVRFYIGHELGHLRMKHLTGQWLRWPVLWLPLLGAAYSRARESTCDRHGLACSSTPEGAAHALSALSAGAERWKQLDIHSYTDQTRYSSGFWMSFHELTAAYPWLTKRAARVIDPDERMPRRNVFAYLFALFIPYTGRLGAGFGFLILIYVIGILAAIAIPAYQQYIVKAKLSSAIIQSAPVRDSLSEYYTAHHEVPKTLETVGAQAQLPDGSHLTLNSDNMILTVATKQGELIFTPLITDDKRLIWSCENGEGIKPKQLPPSCRSFKKK